MRAPVSITLHFKTPIFLSHITFCTDAGQGHQSAVYEISAALYSNELQNNDFIKVGRTNFMKSPKTSHEESVICTLKNFQFPGNKYKKNSTNNSYSGDQIAPVFRLSNVNEILKGVAHLRVSVLKTVNANSSPSISDLRVFGRISFMCRELEIPDNVINELYKSWEDVKQRDNNKKDSKDLANFNFFTSLENNTGRDNDKKQLNDKNCLTGKTKDDIINDPHEFLDSLTSSLMDIPMVLPCGQFVDRKNLDKYVENEAKFGRKPNDPFTGKPFSNTSYPIFDGKLKSRIDEYVLNKNGMSLSCLREKRKRENTQFDSTLIKNSKQLLIHSDIEPTQSSVNLTSNTNDNTTVQGSARLDQSIVNSHIFTENHESAQTNINDSTSSTSSIIQINNTKSKVDSVFQTVLGGRKPIINITSASSKFIKSYTQNEVSGSSKPNLVSTLRTNLSTSNKLCLKKQTKCCKCTEQKNLYQIMSCKHILCRDCIEIMFMTKEKGKFYLYNTAPIMDNNYC